MGDRDGLEEFLRGRGVQEEILTALKSENVSDRYVAVYDVVMDLWKVLLTEIVLSVDV